jgi:drug/metabolite transporter (DMT)-like permease
LSGKSSGKQGAGPNPRRPVAYALSAATLYGIGLPLSKLLLGSIHPVAMAGLLYIGSLVGLCVYRLFRRAVGNQERYEPLKGKDYRWLAGSIMTGGFLAPILLMAGLSLITGFAASLLSNLEAVFTTILAAAIFRESTGPRLWAAVGCMTAGSSLLSYDPASGSVSLLGPLLVTLSMVCWGADNNFTRRISTRDPTSIALWKSMVAGFGPLLICIPLGALPPLDAMTGYAMLVGSFGYGASLVLFIMALKGLGASRTAALFAFAPFIGALVSLIVLKEWLGWLMLPAALLMALGLWLLVYEKHGHAHTHPSERHSHAHTHDDGHHHHAHGPQGHTEKERADASSFRQVGPEGPTSRRKAPQRFSRRVRPQTSEQVRACQGKDDPRSSGPCNNGTEVEREATRGHGNEAAYEDADSAEHVHEHVHEELRHDHAHWPDGEHRHSHGADDE